MSKLTSETIMEKSLFIIALFSCLVILLIISFIFIEAFPAIQEYGIAQFLFGNIWAPNEGQFGVFAMIIGSLYVTFIALLMSVPLSLDFLV